MAGITPEDQKALLTIARTAIEAELIKGRKVVYPETLSPTLAENRGCFVTLHKKGALRGCIGIIEPAKPLVENVQENAVSAAFRDPRFSALREDELKDVDIEVSILTVPRDLAFENPDDLVNALRRTRPGVILSKGWHKATFLPQVWEQLPEPKAFLEHLCLKAGLDKDSWKSKEIRVQTYQAHYFSE